MYGDAKKKHWKQFFITFGWSWMLLELNDGKVKKKMNFFFFYGKVIFILTH